MSGLIVTKVGSVAVSDADLAAAIVELLVNNSYDVSETATSYVSGETVFDVFTSEDGITSDDEDDE